MITLSKAREISLDRISNLEPAFRSRIRMWLDAVDRKGINVLVTEGYRSIERQLEIYNKGVRPCAEPGHSFHNYGLAIDFVPLMKCPKWIDLYEASWSDERSYEICERVAAEFRIRGIDTETGHLQDGRYENWQEAKLSRENPI